MNKTKVESLTELNVPKNDEFAEKIRQDVRDNPKVQAIVEKLGFKNTEDFVIFMKVAREHSTRRCSKRVSTGSPI